MAQKYPTEFPFDEIVEAVQAHYNPKPVITVQWYKFNRRTHREGERIANFVEELRQLATDCKS